MLNRPKDLLKQIEHAETQEELAYKAKKQCYQKLCEELMRKYSEDIMDLEEVFALDISPHYTVESTQINTKISIEPAYDEIEDIDESIAKRNQLKNKIDEIIEEEIRFYLSLDRGEEIWNL